MKPQTMATLSIAALSTGLAMFFYFMLGWDVAASGYGVFWFLGGPSVVLIGVGFLAQFAAIRGFRKEQL